MKTVSLAILAVLASTTANAQCYGNCGPWYNGYAGSNGVFGGAGLNPAIAIGAGLVGGALVGILSPKVYTPPVIDAYPNPVYPPVSQACPYATEKPLYDDYGNYLGTRTSCY